MGPKDVDRRANSVDPDQTRSSLIWVYTVCPHLSVQKLRVITASIYCLHICFDLCIQKLFAATPVHVIYLHKQNYKRDTICKQKTGIEKL